MADLTSASIENPRRCNCGKDGWPGASISDHANRDDVRRCHHGNVWLCTSPGFDPRFRQVSKFGEPIKYHRALAALAGTEKGGA